MKKEVIFSAIFLFLFIIPFMAAANETSLNDAYTCLENQIDEKTCDKLSLEENIFSVLAVKKCKTQLLDNSKDNKCWPKESCNIKTTAQALLALDKAGTSTTNIENWIISKNSSATDIEWYLQVDSEPATCSISYEDSSKTFLIDADKKISSGPLGNCLSLSSNSYWLKINPSCYGKTFEISCDQDFLTSLLFKEEDSETIHITKSTSQGSAGGIIEEQVNSYCFKDGSSCNYEANLWAVLVLNYLGYDMSDYLPYLITLSDKSTNEQYLPESFLYQITNDQEYKTNLLLKQKSQKYWQESSDRYYDTAVALFPFQYETPEEKQNTINWLIYIQDKNGCLSSLNIKNTAFLLASIYPRSFGSSTSGNVTTLDCEDSDYYCMSPISCSNSLGNEMVSYSGSCFGTNICCDQPKVSETCLELGGEKCSSNEICSGGYEEDTASDLDYDEICCVDGSCIIPTSTQNDICTPAGGNCRDLCESDEKIDYNYECSDLNQWCCRKEKKEGGYWWIWVLIILIVLTILAIIFRDKLKPIYMKIKSKFGKGKSGPNSRRGRPIGPPRRPGMPPMGMGPRPPRRPIPPRQALQRRGPKSKGEIDDVLKKLKEMGK